MGQAKIKQRTAFAPELIAEWEGDDCVNFAVALARLTGWLLHVDWWSTSLAHDEEISINGLRPLRVYVADNSDLIFDVRGVRSIADYNHQVLFNVIRKFHLGDGGVYTRFYDEPKLVSLPLRSQPNEEKIRLATTAIRARPHFLASIPSRTKPFFPAYQAAHFTFGRCAPFAEAVHQLTGLQPVALLALKFSPLFEGTKRSEVGYFHSVVLHPDGEAEDSWGKANLKEIASRFGVIEFTTSNDEHRLVVEKLRRSSAGLYQVAFNEAVSLIGMHGHQSRSQ